jgi:hypothetical protein
VTADRLDNWLKALLACWKSLLIKSEEGDEIISFLY